MKTFQILGWILVLLLAGFGLLIYLTQYTCRFRAYALWLITGSIAVFLLLGILGLYAAGTAKVIRLIFATALGLMVLAAAATGLRKNREKDPAAKQFYLGDPGCLVL